MDLSARTIATYTAISIATLILGRVVMGFFGSNKFPVEGKTVLITGASEGLGLSAATQLSGKGANVVLVSRSESKLEAALYTVKAAAKNPETQRFHYIAADVSKESYAKPLLDQVIAWNNGNAPDIVWTCAGLSFPELFVDMEMKSMRNHMDVNYWGTAEMAHAIMREWLDVAKPVEKEPKHLIMTGSIAASYSPPGYTPYTPSKYAMRGLAECIQQEVLLYPQNVKVHLLLPGTILSPGNVRENEIKPEITKIIEKDDPKQTPEEVAALSIRGLEAGQHNITVNFLGHLMKWASFGGTPKNSFVDILGAFLATFVWIFARPILDSQIRGHGKKHGHPSLYKKTRDA
ncbi:uncharacterized protein FIESC28_01339 [Fusarium coffeatum]|uniref:3-dehydrosphinganine reductase n=1 Tax=Fusarium coffeatum TaxID=231269 RepID=A0A366SAZ3_9HYPO|nr:uncharacterized protein FIESC28_01339 [Fusarium coffeatum]RBR25846.1 hypothetical protein FIESC28_01339 [Fusarium coffeatum]